MARVKGNKLIGVAGNLTYRQIDNLQVLQKKPEKVNQSPNSTKSGTIFGKASALSSQIRTNMTPFFAEFTDGGLTNRLNAELNGVAQHYFNDKTAQFEFLKNSFDRLCGIEFNIASKMRNFLWVNLDVDLEGLLLTVKLPELTIHKQLTIPISTDACELKIAVNQFALIEGYHRCDQQEILDIKIDGGTVPPQKWTFPVAEGCLCLVGVALQYSRRRGNKTYVINNKDFSPAIICGAVVTPGKFSLPVVPVSNTATSLWYVMEVNFAGI